MILFSPSELNHDMCIATGLTTPEVHARAAAGSVGALPLEPA